VNGSSPQTWPDELLDVEAAIEDFGFSNVERVFHRYKGSDGTHENMYGIYDREASRGAENVHGVQLRIWGEREDCRSKTGKLLYWLSLNRNTPDSTLHIVTNAGLSDEERGQFLSVGDQVVTTGPIESSAVPPAINEMLDELIQGL
jgi:hypothetical protein